MEKVTVLVKKKKKEPNNFNIYKTVVSFNLLVIKYNYKNQLLISIYDQLT